MTAYERGWTDYELGKRLKDCPYLEGTGAAIAWRAGYRDHERRLT